MAKFDKNKFLEESLLESAETKHKILKHCKEDILKASDKIIEAYKKGGKVMLCGNGGSAADCQHLATELMIRLCHDVSRPALAAIALTTDTSNLTAGSNDIGYENVFARNVEGLGRKGDVLVGISTSGNSKNIIKAFQKAKEIGIFRLALLGGNGGELKNQSDLNIIVPSQNTQRIQEGHITIGHIICEIVEREIYSA